MKSHVILGNRFRFLTDFPKTSCCSVSWELKTAVLNPLPYDVFRGAVWPNRIEDIKCIEDDSDDVIVSLPQELIQEIKRMTMVYFTHGLF